MVSMPKFQVGKFFIFVIATFVAIALVSILIKTIFPDQTFFTEPSVPLLFVVVIASAIIPFYVFVNNKKLDAKDWWGLIIYAAMVLLILMFLPDKFPQYFGDNVLLSDALRNFWDSLELFQQAVIP